jgi:hypothetical protein
MWKLLIGQSGRLGLDNIDLEVFDSSKESSLSDYSYLSLSTLDSKSLHC